MSSLPTARQMLSQSLRAAAGVPGLRELPCALLARWRPHARDLESLPRSWHEPWGRGLHSSCPAAGSLHVKVPALGESITDGTVAAVLKAPGDAVEEDEPIVQIETDKVTVDVRAPKAGTIEAILVKEEENVEVGHMVASIRERVAGIERPLGAAPQPGVGASTSAPAAPAAAPGGRRPSISFPPRRTPEGKVISALPAADAAAALAAFGAAPATAPPPPRVAPVATATGAAPSPRPAMQSQMRVTVLHGAPPPPRVSMTEHKMEVIMLGGAEP